ncbi:MAG: murein L,D-transpeptidase catalytic domain family protein [Chitinophagaceae bacterium]|nr:murein L,D-transpeptidase catalytic domain family protein [Chitinophagaceae bacterium]
MRSFASSGPSFNPKAQNTISNSQISEALAYCKQKQFNTSIAFLINMDLESGENRFFVVDLASKKVLKAGLVTHGRCNQSWLVGRKYGNEVGCGCTSLGKYKIGKPYKGRFGLAYKLYGLEETNNNAFARFVVLHSHECVPEKEVAPAPICQSDGCPTVAPAFLKELAAVIDKSERPVLLWIEGGRIKN